jgi:tRNA nucleotidyltransferase (CCA-adding enzyme)
LTDNAIRRLARRLHPATIDDLALVMRADNLGRPPLHSPETLRLIADLLSRANHLALADSAPRPILLGRHLIAAGMTPGPDFKKLLETALEAQLDGAFHDESTALIWLNNKIPVSAKPCP